MSTAEVPPDLAAALDANPPARAFFATLTGANRYAVLWRLMTARTEQTRARRLENLIAMPARRRALALLACVSGLVV